MTTMNVRTQREHRMRGERKTKSREKREKEPKILSNELREHAETREMGEKEEASSRWPWNPALSYSIPAWMLFSPPTLLSLLWKNWESIRRETLEHRHTFQQAASREGGNHERGRKRKEESRRERTARSLFTWDCAGKRVVEKSGDVMKRMQDSALTRRREIADDSLVSNTLKRFFDISWTVLIKNSVWHFSTFFSLLELFPYRTWIFHSLRESLPLSCEREKLRRRNREREKLVVWCFLPTPLLSLIHSRSSLDKTQKQQSPSFPR